MHKIQRFDLEIDRLDGSGLFWFVVRAADGVGAFGVRAGGGVVVDAVVAEEFGGGAHAQPPLPESIQ